MKHAKDIIYAYQVGIISLNEARKALGFTPESRLQAEKEQEQAEEILTEQAQEGLCPNCGEALEDHEDPADPFEPVDFFEMGEALSKALGVPVVGFSIKQKI